MYLDNQTYCPNFQTCRLVATEEITVSGKQKKLYIDRYCHSYQNEWESCKRFITKNALQVCPDFVLPDTKLTVDQILHRWDKEIQNS